MTDLTKITTPYGLLDAETQKALRSTGETIEKYAPHGWSDDDDPAWVPHIVYRVKPQRPTPREFWINHYPKSACAYLYETEKAANDALGIEGIRIHVREVLE